MWLLPVGWKWELASEDRKFSFNNFVFNFLYMGLDVFASECRYPWNPEEGIRFPRAGVTGSAALAVLGTAVELNLQAPAA